MSQFIETAETSLPQALPLHNLTPEEQDLHIEQILAEVAASHEVVRKFSRSLFGSEVTIELDRDIETAEPYFKVTGHATGSGEVLADLIWKWHEQLCAEVTNHYRLYSLTLLPR
jgi:hypothetical protein